MAIKEIKDGVNLSGSDAIRVSSIDKLIAEKFGSKIVSRQRLDEDNTLVDYFGSGFTLGIHKIGTDSYDMKLYGTQSENKNLDLYQMALNSSKN